MTISTAPTASGASGLPLVTLAPTVRTRKNVPINSVTTARPVRFRTTLCADSCRVPPNVASILPPAKYLRCTREHECAEVVVGRARKLPPLAETALTPGTHGFLAPNSVRRTLGVHPVGVFAGMLARRPASREASSVVRQIPIVLV